jgi:hypothetical protein
MTAEMREQASHNLIVYKDSISLLGWWAGKYGPGLLREVERKAEEIVELEAEVEKLKAQICALKFEREMGGRRA